LKSALRRPDRLGSPLRRQLLNTGQPLLETVATGPLYAGEEGPTDPQGFTDPRRFAQGASPARRGEEPPRSRGSRCPPQRSCCRLRGRAGKGTHQKRRRKLSNGASSFIGRQEEKNHPRLLWIPMLDRLLSRGSGTFTPPLAESLSVDPARAWTPPQSWPAAAYDLRHPILHRIRRSLEHRKRRLPQRLLLRDPAAALVVLDFADQTQSIAGLVSRRRPSRRCRVAGCPRSRTLATVDSAARFSLRQVEDFLKIAWLVSRPQIVGSRRLVPAHPSHSALRVPAVSTCCTPRGHSREDHPAALAPLCLKSRTDSGSIDQLRPTLTAASLPC
jgi:hypothetical protein